MDHGTNAVAFILGMASPWFPKRFTMLEMPFTKHLTPYGAGKEDALGAGLTLIYLTLPVYRNLIVMGQGKQTSKSCKR